MENKTMEELLAYYNKYNNFGKILGKKLEILDQGHIRYTLKVTVQFQALPNMAHGGLLAAMMDGILGVAALSKVAEENKFVGTVEFKINYFKPVKVGSLLIGEGKVIQAGKSILVSEGQINVNGEMVAKGLGTFKSYPANIINKPT